MYSFGSDTDSVNILCQMIYYQIIFISEVVLALDNRSWPAIASKWNRIIMIIAERVAKLKPLV